MTNMHIILLQSLAVLPLNQLNQLLNILILWLLCQMLPIPLPMIPCS